MRDWELIMIILMMIQISVMFFMIADQENFSEHLKQLKANKAKLALRFMLEEGSPDINATAQVKWVVKANVDESGKSKFVMGLEFLDISSEDRNRIVHFVIAQRFPTLR